MDMRGIVCPVPFYKEKFDFELGNPIYYLTSHSSRRGLECWY